jgi:hypothetical protein
MNNIPNDFNLDPFRDIFHVTVTKAGTSMKLTATIGASLLSNVLGAIHVFRLGPS